MKHFRKKSMKPVGSIAAGSVISIALSVLLGLVVTAMLNNEVLAERTSPYVIIFLHFLVSFAGALIAGKSTKQKYAIVCAGVATAYCALLLTVTILLFDSGFSRIGQGVASCYIGAIAACAVCMIKKKRKTKKI